MRNLLVLDDQRTVIFSIEDIFKRELNVISAQNFDDAVAVVDSDKDIDIALIDINLGDSQKRTGIEFLKYLKQKRPLLPCLMLSSLKEVQTVVESMKSGALDYVEKPFEFEYLLNKVKATLREEFSYRSLNRFYEKNKASKPITRSPIIKKLIDEIEKARDLRLLITGEVGAGKTPFVRYSNFFLSQQEKVIRPFEKLNCAGITKELFNNEFFGHIKGSYTGAHEDKKGLVELAEGGDLFLDEIGEIPMECQAMFLTYLDDYEFRRIGDTVKRKAYVRIICATNKDLKKLIKEGKFMLDLYSRIAEIQIHIPPLREHKEDIELLLNDFITRFNQRQKPYEPAVLEQLLKIDYEDANARTLENIVKVMCTHAHDEPKLMVKHIPSEYLQRDVPKISETSSLEEVYQHGIESYMEGVEKNILTRALTFEPENHSVLARKLKIDTSTLWRKFKKYSLK